MLRLRRCSSAPRGDPGVPAGGGHRVTGGGGGDAAPSRLSRSPVPPPPRCPPGGWRVGSGDPRGRGWGCGGGDGGGDGGDGGVRWRGQGDASPGLPGRARAFPPAGVPAVARNKDRLPQRRVRKTAASGGLAGPCQRLRLPRAGRFLRKRNAAAVAAGGSARGGGSPVSGVTPAPSGPARPARLRAPARGRGKRRGPARRIAQSRAPGPAAGAVPRPGGGGAPGGCAGGPCRAAPTSGGRWGPAPFPGDAESLRLLSRRTRPASSSPPVTPAPPR